MEVKNVHIAVIKALKIPTINQLIPALTNPKTECLKALKNEIFYLCWVVKVLE